jgi:hypothetical protein
MSNPPTPFTWATETIYPAGSNAWNGQALSVAPANDYFSPSPATGSPVKIAAENFNYVLQQICANLSQLYQNGLFAVASVAALRALAVPTYNQTVILARGGGPQVITSSTFASSTGAYTVDFGGIYYYDTNYNNLDNGCTAIRPQFGPPLQYGCMAHKPSLAGHLCGRVLAPRPPFARPSHQRFPRHREHQVAPRLRAICRIFKPAVCRRIVQQSAAMSFRTVRVGSHGRRSVSS